VSAEATPIVLLHGAGDDGAAWDPWRARLAPRRVLAPSLPGRSGVPGPAPATVAEAARFVLEYARAQGAERFVVCGYSYGGAIALEIALTAPDRVAALALVSTGARLRVHPRIFEALSAGCDPLRPGEPWAKSVPIESAIADFRAADAFDRLGRPLDVRAPTLVVSGEVDVLTPPKYGEYLAARIAGARLLVVPNEGHSVPFDALDVVTAAVKELAARAG
jgi:pimeloyl-ACP methyl ester carboxylesterase